MAHCKASPVHVGGVEHDPPSHVPEELALADEPELDEPEPSPEPDEELELEPELEPEPEEDAEPEDDAEPPDDAADELLPVELLGVPAQYA